MKNPSSLSTLVLAVLLALAVGYIVGVGRGDAPSARAVAGPTEGKPQGYYLTTDPGGTQLCIWSVEAGRVASARAYDLQADRRIEPPGRLIVENPRIGVTNYTSFAPPPAPAPAPTAPPAPAATPMDGK